MSNQRLAKTIVIKPTMKCNLRCEYCYEFIRNGKRYSDMMMNIDKLCEIVWRTARLFQDSRILWMFHGGEPLLLGKEYIIKFLDCLREVNNTFPVDFKFAIQSNSTLISEDIIQILETNLDLLSERIVSISIDGPKEINDEARHDPQNRSSFDMIESTIDKLKKSSLVFSTITVVGTHNVDYPEQVYEQLKQIGARLCKFIPNYNTDSSGNPNKYGITPIDYANFMCRIFDLWMHDLPNQKGDSRMVIEPIASIICTLTDSFVTWCEYREEKCSNFYCIYPDGDMWLCDDYNQDLMGDIAYTCNIDTVSDDDFKALLLSPGTICKYDSFYQTAMESCKNCDVFDYCKGGCLATHYDMKTKSNELFEAYCDGKKKLINYIKEGVNLALSES